MPGRGRRRRTASRTMTGTSRTLFRSSLPTPQVAGRSEWCHEGEDETDVDCCSTPAATRIGRVSGVGVRLGERREHAAENRADCQGEAVCDRGPGEAGGDVGARVESWCTASTYQDSSGPESRARPAPKSPNATAKPARFWATDSVSKPLIISKEPDR